MLIKSCVLGAVLVSTPLALWEAQEPATPPQSTKALPAQGEPNHAAELRRTQVQLEQVRRELAGAKRDLVDMRRQIGELLDQMDAQLVTQCLDEPHGP